MSDEGGNDSPAFRLRPRQAAPKSYYTVRLEFSGNPASFIRDRSKGNKRKSGGSAVKNANNIKKACNSNIIKIKEERKYDEKRLQMRRETKRSITTDTPLSPFLEQIHISELQPNSTYEHNYISLDILKVVQSNEAPLLTCLCQARSDPGDSDDASMNSTYQIYVTLYDEYSDVSKVRPGKSISIAKFRTSSKLEIEDEHDSPSNKLLPFSVIIKYVPVQGEGSKNDRDPLIPFVSVTDMIESHEQCYKQLN